MNSIAVVTVAFAAAASKTMIDSLAGTNWSTCRQARPKSSASPDYSAISAATTPPR